MAFPVEFLAKIIMFVSSLRQRLLLMMAESVELCTNSVQSEYHEELPRALLTAKDHNNDDIAIAIKASIT